LTEELIAILTSISILDGLESKRYNIKVAEDQRPKAETIAKRETLSTMSAMLNTPIETAINTTKAHVKKLREMRIETVRDFLWYVPRRLENQNLVTRSEEIMLNIKNVVAGRLCDISSQPSRSGKKLYKAVLKLSDGGLIDVIWFRSPYALKNISDEQSVQLVGKIEHKYGKIQMPNPEIHIGDSVHTGDLRAMYPESPPITSKWVRQKITPLLPLCDNIPSLLPELVRTTESLYSTGVALRQLHSPKSAEAWETARKSIGFGELLELQIKVMLARHKRKKNNENKHYVPLNPAYIKEILGTLPFTLTGAQKVSLYEILKDFEGELPMRRLVQGDVGSGKTIVGFIAAKALMQSGAQACLMAPTEILAKQHYENAKKFFGEKNVALLIGSLKEKEKKEVRKKLKEGTIAFVVGTHALITESTIFNNLGLAIIDEQHRFGVKQRAALEQNDAHMLAMTATPIPRSLALTVYGEQDISVINELPPGRKPAITRIITGNDTIRKCNIFMDDQIEKGHQIFWICPLIDESEKIEAQFVHGIWQELAENIFPNRRVQLLHGRMKAEEKDKIMQDFADKKFDILVSTSVIEVGVDIPNATVMVIENAERFGLSQLHQFRGRIGRSDLQSYCFLKVGKEEQKEKARLQALERSTDGFYLSEMDMKLRGVGQLYGTKQSGLPDFLCADILDTVTIKKARDYAAEIVSSDPTLERYPELKRAVESGAVYF